MKRTLFIALLSLGRLVFAAPAFDQKRAMFDACRSHELCARDFWLQNDSRAEDFRVFSSLLLQQTQQLVVVQRTRAEYLVLLREISEQVRLECSPGKRLLMDRQTLRQTCAPLEQRHVSVQTMARAALILLLSLYLVTATTKDFLIIKNFKVLQKH